MVTARSHKDGNMVQISVQCHALLSLVCIWCGSYFISVGLLQQACIDPAMGPFSYRLYDVARPEKDEKLAPPCVSNGVNRERGSTSARTPPVGC